MGDLLREKELDDLLLLGEWEVGDLLWEKGLDDLLAIVVPTSCKINQVHATLTIINLSHLATLSLSSSARRRDCSTFASIQVTHAFTVARTWHSVPACSSKSLILFKRTSTSSGLTTE